MIEILNKLKNRDFFPEEEWGERGLIPSEEEIIEKMKLEIKNFIDFLIRLYQSQPTQQKIIQEIQRYFDEWDRNDFDTEEMEFIFDEFFEILREIKIEPDKFDV
ncbi:hypothetical protein BH10ACI1_BH10ACI1_05540 [soil metagenome]